MPAGLIDLLDLRCPRATRIRRPLCHRRRRSASRRPVSGCVPTGRCADRVGPGVLAPRASRRATPAVPLTRSGRPGAPFDFSDCSLGNLVFAGSLPACRTGDFNQAVDDYCALVGLPAGLIENVTDGTNAYLVAIDADGQLLATEEAIVDAARPNRIREIYLIDRPLTAHEREVVGRGRLGGGGAASRARSARSRSIRGWRRRSRSADLIIYAPGTQHSSLFPSYLTPGLAEAIAGNLSAMKVLVTNIQADAEITGSNAVDLLERAVYYLKDKGACAGADAVPRSRTTLLNDPAHAEGGESVRAARSDRGASRIRGWSGSATTRTASPAGTTRHACSAVHRRRSPDAASGRAWPCCCTTTSSIEQDRADPAGDGSRRSVERAGRRDGVLSQAPSRSIRGSRRVCRLPFVHCRDGDPWLRRGCAAGRLRLRRCCSNRPACTAARRPCRCSAQLGHGPARCGVGQPPAVGPRHRGIVPLPLRRNALARRDQLPRQLRAEPRVPGPVRPIHLRHAVRRPRGPRGRRAAIRVST